MCWIGSAGSSKTATRIFIFSIVLGAKCLSYLKSIETHARAFSRLISDCISGVFVDMYREFSPYANFITADFVTAVFQKYY